MSDGPIAALSGDGIGREAMPGALRVLLGSGVTGTVAVAPAATLDPGKRHPGQGV